jgi:hypothetical protein
VPARYRTIAKAMRAARPGDRVVVSGGKWRHVRVARPGVVLAGQDGAVIVGTAKLTGRGSQLVGFTIRGSVVSPKRAEAIAVRGNTFERSGTIRADGDNVVIEENTIDVAPGGTTTGYAIAAFGGRAQVIGNRVQAASPGVLSAIVVTGRESSVTSNVVSVSGDPAGGSAAVAGIEVLGSHVTVEENDVSHSASAAGIVVRGDGATVSANSLHAATGGGAIVIGAGGALVSSNTIDGSGSSVGNGIELVGDGNRASWNTITGVGGDGLHVVSGAYVTLDSNAVTDARRGVHVYAEASDTRIVTCTASAADVGLLNAGSRTRVSGCTFLANRDHDVVVSNPCLVFEDNLFDTSLGTLEQPPDATPIP